MGMSTSIIFLRDGSSVDHQKRVAAMKALIEIKEDPTKSLLDYFGISEVCEFQEDRSGLELEKNGSVSAWSNEYAEGFEVDLEKIPCGVVKIRFYNSW